ncbi:hypothetical protein I4U23_000717 [Adineta vaga]|nr:hypothetical protein I4U23_000717 [Adineta vaga]
MIRFVFFKRFCQPCIYVCLFLIINGLLFKLYSTNKQLCEQPSAKPDITNSFFSFDRTSQQSVQQYFEWKKQLMKQSSFKVTQRHAFAKSPNKSSFLIYEYTRYRQFCRRLDHTQVFIPTCPFRNCYFTCNSSLINQVDAIVAHCSSTVNYTGLFNLRTSRNPNQIWMLWHDEPFAPSPMFNRLFFNWTISYRSNSEISVGAYGITFRRNEPLSQVTFNQWIYDNYHRRRNQAIWFVSNCRPKERLRYYEELREHYLISAFGKCIDHQTANSSKCIRSSDCELEQLATAKFYLAFESTTLRFDYITEKFWRSLSHGIIPIVLGPKRQDYERIVPPHSFIYAQDYLNAQTLAQHLDHVATNVVEYEKYHRWRMNYETRYLGRDLEPFRFCELCYQLNTNRDRIWYDDIHRYFAETNQQVKV